MIPHRLRIFLAGIFVATAAVHVLAAEQSSNPLAPAQELATLKFADPNLVAELIAAEPDVVAPVAMAWDANGRLFVVEMTDYPSGPVSGRIKLLENPDADGRYRKATVFADHLAFPSGITPWKNGMLVTAAPDIWFLADTNGDGIADVKQKFLTGFVEGNQQLRVNGLFWGIDNWIYGANGRSGGEVTWENAATSGTAAPRTSAISVRNRDFRFRPDTGQFEAIAGHSQFGMGHDDWGNRFPVFNNMPIRHVALEQRYLDRQAALAGIDNVPNTTTNDADRRVYGLAPPLLMIPQPVGYFTSACGPSILRGLGLGETYYGDAFVCEPVQNVVTRRKLFSNGPTFIARRVEQEKEFLASTDPWFHGVFTCTGPDGCLYVVDFYRKYVEHPHWVADKFKNTTPWREGENHGRIWRIKNLKLRIKNARPDLQDANARDLVAHLSDETGWWRDTAQRLLVERQDKSLVPALEKLARTGSSPQTRLHALHTLSGLEALGPELLAQVLKDSDARVRQHAAELAETLLRADAARALSSPQRAALRAALFDLARDPDAGTRQQLALTLGEIGDAESLDLLAGLAAKNISDRWQATAILSSAGKQPLEFLQHVAPRLQNDSDEQLDFLNQLAAMTSGAQTSDASQFISWTETVPFPRRLIFLAGYFDGRKNRGNSGLSPVVPQDALESALKTVNEPTIVPRLRVAAIRVLARTTEAKGASTLHGLLSPRQPEPVQLAAARALLESNVRPAADKVFADWNLLGRLVRRQVISSAPRFSRWAEALVSALSEGKISPAEVDVATRQSLLKSGNAGIRDAAQTFFAASSDRQAVVEKFSGATDMPGDAKRGAVIFARICLTCHSIQGIGAKVGPDLSGIVTHSKETLLVDIFDPNRQVLPDFVSYTLLKNDGETLTGILAAESGESITLRNANVADVTVARAEIKELRADGKSLMPEGLEQGLSAPDVADLLEFLHHADKSLFPPETK